MRKIVLFSIISLIRSFISMFLCGKKEMFFELHSIGYYQLNTLDNHL
jgi:hypothetical protein